MGVCEGGGFSERSPSLALPPEERLAFGGLLLLRWLRLKVRGDSCEMIVSTAADRAAADMRHKRRNMRNSAS